jgi:hypothetical protein
MKRLYSEGKSNGPGSGLVIPVQDKPILTRSLKPSVEFGKTITASVCKASFGEGRHFGDPLLREL